MVNRDRSQWTHNKYSYGKGKKGKEARLRDAQTTNRSAVVRVYIEGGSPSSLSARFFREAWGKFLKRLDDAARSNGFSGLRVIQGGSRYEAHKSFQNRALSGSYDVNILLIDSEIPTVKLTDLWLTLGRTECGGFSRPLWATEDHIYLMVPTVESWLMTDHDALANYYNRRFDRTKLLPSDANLENAIKTDIDKALEDASNLTGKGKYSHGEGNKIIEFIDPDIVVRLPHAERLFTHLEQFLIASNPGNVP